MVTHTTGQSGQQITSSIVLGARTGSGASCAEASAQPHAERRARASASHRRSSSLAPQADAPPIAHAHRSCAPSNLSTPRPLRGSGVACRLHRRALHRRTLPSRLRRDCPLHKPHTRHHLNAHDVGVTGRCRPPPAWSTASPRSPNCTSTPCHAASRHSAPPNDR